MSLTNLPRYTNPLEVGEACLKAYVETGSLPKAAEKLYRDGYVTPRDGRKFDPTDVARMARKALLSNPNKYRELVNVDSNRERGRDFTQDEWERFLVEEAMKLYRYSPKRFQKFISQHNLSAYQSLWTDKHGLSTIKTKSDRQEED